MTAASGSVASASRILTVALAGNPNVGKSSLFNALTGLRQKIANYPGVTVERHEGVYPFGGREYRIVDLPGTYSLIGRSPDERVAGEVLTGTLSGEAEPDVVVVVIEAANVRRGLFLYTQIADLELPMVVCLNMVDEAVRAGVDVSGVALSRALGGVPVVETVATGGRGIAELRQAIADVSATVADAEGSRLSDADGHRATRWRELQASADLNQTAETQRRYGRVNEIVSAAGFAARPALRVVSDRIDRVVMHPALGFAIFAVVMGCIFQAVFSWAQPVTDAIDTVFGAIRDWITTVLPASLWRELVTDGVISGVGSVVVFLPQILILFLFLGVLEDSGYMTRAAFIVDRPLRALGLSGRSFIPLLSSFACAVPGIMATRTIEDRRERLATILIAPLMTCSARLPVYALILSAFVPDTPLFGPIRARGATMLALYVAGVATASVAAWVIGKTVLRGKRVSPIIEMPPYRVPNWRSIAVRLQQRAWAFLGRAGTVIFAVSVLLWVATHVPVAERRAGMTDEQFQTAQLNASVAGRLGHTIEPVIRPLGFDWRIGVGLVSSFMAREVFVATMGVVYSVGDPSDSQNEVRLQDAFRNATNDRTGRRLFDWPTIVSLLAFYVVAPQCVSTVAVVRRETGGWRWPLFLVGYLAVFSYLFAWAAYQVTKWIV